MHGIAGDDQFLVGADQRSLDLGLGGRDDGIRAEGSSVGLVIEAQSEVGEVLQDAAAEPAVVLADATGEDDQVNA